MARKSASPQGKNNKHKNSKGRARTKKSKDVKNRKKTRKHKHAGSTISTQRMELTLDAEEHAEKSYSRQKKQDIKERTKDNRKRTRKTKKIIETLKKLIPHHHTQGKDRKVDSQVSFLNRVACHP